MLYVSGTGRLTKKPEIRFTPGGTAVTTLSVATNERQKGKKDSIASFFDVVVWGKAAEWASQYLDKGEPVEISGRLRQNRFEKDGQKRSRVEVIAQNVSRINGKGKNPTAEVPEQGCAPTGDDAPAGDEIPF